MPGTEVVVLFVLVIDKSETGWKSRATVDELLAELGSAMPLGCATVAVFVSVPVAVLAACAVNVKVAVPFTARFTVVLRFPVPLVAVQLEPADAAQVHVAPLNVAGKLSVTVAPVTAIGPLLVTTIV